VGDIKEVTVYMDGVDWQHELGEGGDTVLYESLNTLKLQQGCVSECGAVKIRARLELVE
jgi:hypothetical protein